MSDNDSAAGEYEFLEDLETTVDRDTAAFIAAGLSELPPLADDLTARMLGLVPDPNRSLDASRLKSARTATRLGVEGLAALLTARGWKVAPLTVLHWESGQTSAVPPAMIAAIADELGIVPDRLTRSVQAPAASRLQLLSGNAILASLVDRVAKAKSLSVQAAFSFLEQSQPSFAYRGQADDDQYLQILAQFVRHLEQDASDGGDG